MLERFNGGIAVIYKPLAAEYQGDFPMWETQPREIEPMTIPSGVTEKIGGFELKPGAPVAVVKKANDTIAVYNMNI